MPLYDYKCEDCGERFEKRLAFKDADIQVACPTCAGEQTRRLMGVVMLMGVGAGMAADTGGGCCQGGQCACHA